MRKKTRKPYCNQVHQYGHLTLSNDDMPIKKCKHCPAVQTKKEFMKEKTKRMQERGLVKISHVDLFYF